MNLILPMFFIEVAKFYLKTSKTFKSGDKNLGVGDLVGPETIPAWEEQCMYMPLNFG